MGDTSESGNHIVSVIGPRGIKAGAGTGVGVAGRPTGVDVARGVGVEGPGGKITWQPDVMRESHIKTGKMDRNMEMMTVKDISSGDMRDGAIITQLQAHANSDT